MRTMPIFRQLEEKGRGANRAPCRTRSRPVKKRSCRVAPAGRDVGGAGSTGLRASAPDTRRGIEPAAHRWASATWSSPCTALGREWPSPMRLHRGRPFLPRCGLLPELQRSARIDDIPAVLVIGLCRSSRSAAASSDQRRTARIPAWRCPSGLRPSTRASGRWGRRRAGCFTPVRTRPRFREPAQARACSHNQPPCSPKS